MNLLIIGNGFDLAHNLPTRYTDFLRYCRNYDTKYPVSQSDELNEEFSSLMADNIWLEYFLKITPNLDDSGTWIDFEKEIARIIREIELGNPAIGSQSGYNMPDMKLLGFEWNDGLVDISDDDKLDAFISTFCIYDEDLQNYIIRVGSIIDVKSFTQYIYCQLRNFTRAFEIYCLKVNETQVETGIVSCDRRNKMVRAARRRDDYAYQARNAAGYGWRQKEVPELERKRDEEAKLWSELSSGISTIDYLSMSKFDCVLSFNYTNTYERLYGNDKTQYCYLHGKAQEDGSKSNLVFGIDDDLPNGEESSNFKWVRFKKYYQRIILKTGSEYKDWLKPKNERRYSQDFVHIAGHSLDRTDYEVLYEIFSNEDFKIIIYYYSQDDFEDKVQKVIQLLSYKGMNGRDELIRRVHGKEWSIKFVDQYDEKNGLFVRV